MVVNSTLAVIEEREVLGKDFRVYGTAENPLFLSKDVAEWIDYSGRTGQLLSTVDEVEKLTHTIYASGQNREMWFLTEDGLYEVLMQSRKPIAKEFKKQVKEILKQIRKTGGYIPVNKNESDLDIMAKAVLIAQITIEEKSRLLAEKDKQLLEQKPKVEKYDVLMNEDKLMSIGDLAKHLNSITNGRKFGRNRLIELLRNNGVLNSNNIPYQTYIDRGYFEVKLTNSNNGNQLFSSTLATMKGVDLITGNIISGKW